MSLQKHTETASVFFKCGVREWMKEKKNGILKTAKLNASLASKIRTKTINNSSIIKVSLKQNNKALALALNAAKITAQKLTDDKMLLQKEVKLGHFENACLRQKLSSVNKYIDELQLFMNSCFQTAIKMTRFSESDSCSLLLNERGHGVTHDTSGNQDGGHCPSRVVPKCMRIPLSHVDDEESDNGRNMPTSLETFPLDPSESAFGETWRNVPFPAIKKPFSSFTNKSLATSGKSGQELHGVDGSASALNSSTIFGDNLWNVPQNSRSCSLSMLDKNYPVQQCEDTTRPCSDSLLLSEHVTKRKKRKTGSSAAFGNNFKMGMPDTDDLQWTKKTESLAKDNLEVSHVGELITLNAKNKSYMKIKANETKTLEKGNAETKNRSSSLSQSKIHLDNSGNGRMNIVTMSKTNELNSSNIKLPKAACHPENSGQSRKEECSSQYLDQATRNRRTFVVEPACVNNCNLTTQEIKKRIFSEKMKNLEDQFQSPESSSLSNEMQQNEKSYGYSLKCPNKNKGYRRAIVLDPAPPNHRKDCTSFQHDTEEKADLENEGHLGRWFQSPESNSLNIIVNTELSVGFQKQVPSHEGTLGLNVKRKQSKRKVHEIDGSYQLSEMERQSLDNINSEIQQSKNKIKKRHSVKAANANSDIIQREHCSANTDVFNLSEKAVEVSKKRKKPRNTQAAFSVSLDDEGILFEDRDRSSVQKNWSSSTTPNGCSASEPNCSHSGKTDWIASSYKAGLQKNREFMSTFSKKTCTVNDLSIEGANSEFALQGPEKCETSQTNQTKWSFLQVPGCRALKNPSVVDITKTSPLNPDSPSAGLSKSSSYSHSMLHPVEAQTSPERDSAMPTISTVFKQNVEKPMVSGRQKQPIQAVPEISLQSATLQENGNKVLKDLTNSIPLETSSICPSRRRKIDVSYAEPKLNRKLRRGDPFTITDFLSSPIYKTKNKKLTKRTGKSRKTKNIGKKEVQLTFDD